MALIQIVGLLQSIPTKATGSFFFGTKKSEQIASGRRSDFYPTANRCPQVASPQVASRKSARIGATENKLSLRALSTVQGIANANFGQEKQKSSKR
jgi:hypothetical protein